MHSHCKDIKGDSLSAYGGDRVGDITAGAGSDDTERTTDSIEVASLAARPAAVCFEIPVKTTLAADETLTVSGTVEKSIDGSTWVEIKSSETVLTMTATGSGVIRIGSDIVQSDAKYVRAKYTADLSASGTDTATIEACVARFGGLDKAPISE